jgi:hypothetical protein
VDYPLSLRAFSSRFCKNLPDGQGAGTREQGAGSWEMPAEKLKG